MRIFVTGGTGFNGRYVVQRLDNGKNKLLLLTRNTDSFAQSKNIFSIKGDLAQISIWKDDVKKFKPQAGIHLAWEGISDYSIQNSIKNLNYGLTLIEFLGKIGCKTILVSGSILEYGNQQGKLKEDICLKPFNALTGAKNSLHYLGKEIAKAHKVNFIWTRLSNSYGPGRHETSLIPYLIQSITKNRIIKLRNPKAENDFIYVEDVAEAICQLILKYKKSGVFNIGSGKLISVEDILKKLFKILNVDRNYLTINQKQIDSFSFAYADISKIKKEIGWQPKIDITEGLKKTVTASKKYNNTMILSQSLYTS